MDTTSAGCFDAVAGGTDEVGAFDVTAATPVTIIVDGFTPAEVSAFTLTLAQADDGACIDDGPAASTSWCIDDDGVLRIGINHQIADSGDRTGFKSVNL